MQISIDKSACLGCGMCAQKCSQVFKMGDDGKSEVINPTCCGNEGCCGCDINETAKECPANAIKID